MQIDMDFICSELKRRTGMRQLAAVSKGTGLSLTTLHNIKHGKGVTTKTAGTLQQFLKDNQRKGKLGDGRE